MDNKMLLALLERYDNTQMHLANEKRKIFTKIFFVSNFDIALIYVIDDVLSKENVDFPNDEQIYVVSSYFGNLIFIG